MGGYFFLSEKFIGLCLACLGNTCISFGLNLQKYCHMQAQARGLASAPTNDALWITGIIMMVGGELGNFLAYGFAPASLVSPLGAISVVLNAILANRFLKEKFRQRDFVGVVVVLIGASIITYSAPSGEENFTVPQLEEYIYSWTVLFWSIFLVVTVGSLLLSTKKYGHRYVVVFLLICSLLGSITVVSMKGLSIFLRMTIIERNNQFTYALPYILLLAAACTGALQITYLNRAFAAFDATEVVPVYYVLFTLSTIAGGVVVYREFSGVDFDQVMNFVYGCTITFYGVYLITSKRRKGKSYDIMPDLPIHIDNDETESSDEGERKRLLPPSAHVAPIITSINTDENTEQK